MSKRYVVPTLFVLATGCAPTRFEQAVDYYAARNRVSDAGVHRVRGYWHLRFDALLISDLEDAATQRDTTKMRTGAERVLRAANTLGRNSAGGEIDRLPQAVRTELASRAGVDPSAEALKQQYGQRADAAIDELVAELKSLPTDALRRRLRTMRHRIEPAPDDRGRLLRQTLLALGAVPAWIGVGVIEADLEADRPTKLATEFDRAVVWRPPPATADADPLHRWAPVIAVEWPTERSYPEDSDRIGKVWLSGMPDDINVHIDISRPMVYGYTTEAKIHGRRFPQLVYNWWFPRHPEMRKGDPGAGHIDGDVLRITLDRNGRPAVFETLQSCGCFHMVFVARHVEDAARAAFGTPLADKTYVVERDLRGNHNLIVAGTLDVPATEAQFAVTILAGRHEVTGVVCLPRGREPDLPAVETRAYEVEDYDVLDRLPLGHGVASMFGPDGLVHKAGRAEGMLLAPTGILSAGQPRKRGTQKIRWDVYSFDDPHLLERALRLPENF